MAILEVVFFYQTVIFDVPPVWGAFSQLSWAPMIQLHALGPTLDKYTLEFHWNLPEN